MPSTSSGKTDPKSGKGAAFSSKSQLKPLSESMHRFLVPKESIKVTERSPNKPAVASTSAAVKGKKRAILVDDLDEEDTSAELWVDRFQPASITELAVHKKKIEDVRRWLSDALEGGRVSKYRRILVLSGPAGSAKTATLRALSQDMDFDLVEYKTSEGGADSLTEEFPTFLARAGVMTSLAFGPALDIKAHPPIGPSTSKKAKLESKLETARKRVILVEDLPNIFTSQPTRATFRAALMAFANSNRSVSQGTPLVLIISEAMAHEGNSLEYDAGTSGRAWESNVTARTIVPLDVLQGGKCHEIKFNPVAPTILIKALGAICDRLTEAARSRTSKRPSKVDLDGIAKNSNGDIRSAITYLQLLVRDGIRPAIDLPRKGKKGAGGDGSTMHLAARETSLFVFHALNRVLYSKRWGENEEDDAKDTRVRPPKARSLPSHLKQFARRQSKVDPNAMFDDVVVGSDMFRAYLHQNYPAFTTDIDHCMLATEAFSSAEAVTRIEGESFNRHPMTAHYSFQLAVRGTLMALPSPVPRKGQKVYKAAIWDKQSAQRDNEAALHESFNVVSSFVRTRRDLAVGFAPFIRHLEPRLAASIPRQWLGFYRTLGTFAPPSGQTRELLDDGTVDPEDDADEPAVPTNTQPIDVMATTVADKLYLSDDDIEEF